MKTRSFALAVILLFVARGFAFADRQLDRAEVEQLFQTLTAQPTKTWVPNGSIQAVHQEYNSSTELTIDSTVTVKYDGSSFYWEINIDSYTKQAKPQAGPRSKPLRNDPDLELSKRRVFAWDGQRYTMYFEPGNHAIVTETPGSIPVAVNGPLTAGLIPWGHGMYMLENLLAMESSAWADDQGQIHLTLNKTNAPEMVFVLDPSKDYAVLSCSMDYAEGSSTVNTYRDYELVSGRWIPTVIFIERYDNSKQPSELLSYDYWNLTSVRAMSHHPASFRASYKANALIEFYPPVADKLLSHRFHSDVDTESLFQKRLATALAPETQAQNCATIAVKYVAEQLGKDVADSNLAALVNEPNQATNLYEMRKFARQLGLHCRAVKTDIQTLKSLDCQVILHLPGPNHYIVLERIDDEYVWLIDLDNDKFYYNTRLDEFDLDWSDGTALLISNGPLTLGANSTEINDSKLRKIIGASAKYSCTDLIQSYDIQFCSDPVGGLCGGRYRLWHTRYGCEANSEGGSCTGTGFIGNQFSPCINDPYDPGSCTITGEWFPQYIRACQ
jgi:hypothetical protein